jgi:hypothetical protein
MEQDTHDEDEAPRCSCGAKAETSILDGPACGTCLWAVWISGRRPLFPVGGETTPFDGLRVPMALKGEMARGGLAPDGIEMTLQTEEGRAFAAGILSTLFYAQGPEVPVPWTEGVEPG